MIVDNNDADLEMLLDTCVRNSVVFFGLKKHNGITYCHRNCVTTETELLFLSSDLVHPICAIR